MWMAYSSVTTRCWANRRLGPPGTQAGQRVAPTSQFTSRVQPSSRNDTLDYAAQRLRLDGPPPAAHGRSSVTDRKREPLPGLQSRAAEGVQLDDPRRRVAGIHSRHLLGGDLQQALPGQHDAV